MGVGIKNLGTLNNMVEITINNNEYIYVYHPNTIIAFQATDCNKQRKDGIRFKNLFNKHEFIETTLNGPATTILAVPPGCYVTIIDLEEHEDMLYDYKNLLFISQGIEVNKVIQKIRNMVISQSIFKVKLSGKGQVGLISGGALHAISLNKENPVYVKLGNLVSLPAKATWGLHTYGNELAVQNGGLHYEITGTGKIFVEAISSREYLKQMKCTTDNIGIRIIKEYIPGASIIIP